MFCVHCGANNSESAVNCENCEKVLFPGSNVRGITQHQTPISIEPSISIAGTASAADKRGLNTKQMVALWYGAIASLILLAFSGSTLAIGICLAIGTGILVYTFSHHPRVNKKKAFLWVFGPLVMICAVAAGIFLYDSHPTVLLSEVPIPSAQLFDMHLALNSTCGDLTGRLRNRSEKTIKSVKLRVTLSDANGTIDGADTEITVNVPPGETRSITGSVCSLREAPGWTWTYNVLDIQGE